MNLLFPASGMGLSEFAFPGVISYRGYNCKEEYTFRIITSTGKKVSHDGLMTAVCNEDLGNGSPESKCSAAAVFED